MGVVLGLMRPAATAVPHAASSKPLPHSADICALLAFFNRAAHPDADADAEKDEVLAQLPGMIATAGNNVNFVAAARTYIDVCAPGLGRDRLVCLFFSWPRVCFCAVHAPTPTRMYVVICTGACTGFDQVWRN